MRLDRQAPQGPPGQGESIACVSRFLGTPGARRACARFATCRVARRGAKDGQTQPAPVRRTSYSPAWGAFPEVKLC